MGFDVHIFAFQDVIADILARLVPLAANQSVTQTLTLQLSVKVDYPVDLNLKSLDGKVSQRRFTAVVRELTAIVPSVVSSVARHSLL